MLDARTTHRFGGYEVMLVPGRDERLLVSVSSLGQPDGTVPFEWVQTLDQRGGDQHVLYVRDTRQSWYNAAAGWTDLLDWLAAYQAAHYIRWTAAFGVSAGGFGALLLAEHLPLQRVVALCPQAGIDETAGFDQRYRSYWDRIGPMARPRAAQAFIGAPDVFCCFSVDAAEDVIHADLLRQRNRCVLPVPFRGAHNLAGEFRLRDLTDAFITEVLAAAPDFGRLGAIAPDARFVALAEAYLAFVRRDIDEPAWRELIGAVPAAAVPAYAYHWLAERLIDEASAACRDHAGVTAASAWPAHRGRTAIVAQIGPYLARGWSPADHAGAWSIGRWHFLRAWVADEPSGETCRVTLHLRVWVPARRPAQTIRYWQRGTLLREIRYERAGTDFLECREPFELVAPGLELLLETPDAVSPAEITDGNKDGRRLAVFLTRIGFG
jgi:hypothetical protein